MTTSLPGDDGASADSGAEPAGADSGAGAAGADSGAGAAGEPPQNRPGEKPSGLRNPAAAVRGLGAGTLALEAIVLLLAIQPIRVLGGDLSGWAVGSVVALAVLCAVIAGSMKRRWAWHAGTAVQVVLLLSGLFHWSLAVLGLIFGAAWWYASSVRRAILG